jgi:hypothetical protein
MAEATDGVTEYPLSERLGWPTMTLGNVVKARVRLLAWCRDRHHQCEPDPAEMAARYGARTSVLSWHERLVYSRCGNRQVDMMVSGSAIAALKSKLPPSKPEALPLALRAGSRYGVSRRRWR